MKTKKRCASLFYMEERISPSFNRWAQYSYVFWGDSLTIENEEAPVFEAENCKSRFLQSHVG